MSAPSDGPSGEGPRPRSVTEEAAEVVAAVREWSADPEVRAKFATAATSLLEAGAALFDTVAERHRSRPDPAGSSPAGEEPTGEERTGEAPTGEAPTGEAPGPTG